MSSNFNNAKIINVYYNKGDRKPYDVNGKPIAYIGEEAIGATEATTIRFYLGEDLDSSTAVIVTKRPDGERRLDLCEKFGTGVNSYYQVTLNAWYGAVKGKATLAFKVYNGEVEFDDEETPTEIISVEGRIVVSDIFNLEIAYAPEADLIVPADDTPDYVEWFAVLSTKLDKAQSITVTGALPTLTGAVYDDRWFFVKNEGDDDIIGNGKLYYIDGSTAIEVIFGVGTIRLTPTGNGNNTADTGKLSWNQPNGTVNVGLYNDVNIGVGEDVIYYVKATGAITKGDVIQYAGFQGDHALAKRAVQSEINANPKLIMGIAKQNIANGDFGYIAHFGKLEGVDTKSFGVNSFVWFDSAGSTAGNWTITEPTAPNAKILLAVIIKATTGGGQPNGILLVRPTIEPSVKELQDVLITSIANEQVLRWNATNSRWENTGALTTAESNITNLQGRMTTEEANVDNLQGRMTSAEGDIDDIESGATIVPRALGDQNGNTINTTYLTQSSASATYIPLSQKAQANGVATLGADGRVVASQIPSVVTSLEEYDSLEDFPETGFLTVVYLAMDTGLTYLWSGTQYVIISSSLALGETSTTAYRGDRGKIAYDYSQVGHLPLAGGNITNNLNVSGNVGIGTTSPGASLEVFLTSGETFRLNTGFGGGNTVDLNPYILGVSNAGFSISLGETVRQVITSSGNVGIGTTSPGQKLTVTGAKTDPSLTANATAVANFIPDDIGIQLVVGGSPSNNAMWLQSRHLTVNDLAYSLLLNPSGGNVGIGTPSPSQKLHVVGNARIEGNLTVNGTLTQINTDVTNTEQLNITNDGTGPAIIANQKGNQPVIDFQDDGVSAFYIANGGNVGIGTTSPSSSLQINDNLGFKLFIARFTGNSNDDPQLQLNIAKATRPSYSFDGDNDTGIYSPSANVIGISTNAVERIRIDSSGNVGIGTTSPNDQLEIKNNSGAFMSLNVSAAGSDATPKPAGLYYRGYLNNRLGGIVMDDRTGSISDSGPMIFYNSTNMLNDTLTERMRIDSNGNVGIGTNNPQSKLHINGTIRVDGNIQFPATQVASSDGNNLDDYEEGDWTPVLQTSGTSPTVTYANQVGKYTKIGNIVNVQCFIRATVSNVGTGTPEVTGLPFSAFSMLSGVSIGLQTIFATQLPASFSNGFIDGTKVNFGSTTYSTSSTVYITFSATYRVA